MEHSTQQASTEPQITIRAIQPDFANGTNPYWFNDNPFTTHMVNTLSFHFPPGEQMFVKSVNFYRDQITDPELKKAVRAFTGQEMLHSKVHDAFNEWVASRVPDAEVYCREITQILEQRYAERVRSNPLINLAVTVSLEHMTAIMAATLLRREDIIAKIDPEVRALLIWHAIEEIEHKSVAFDVYQSVGGSYRLRVLAMLLSTFMLTKETIKYQIKLLKHDGELGNWRAALTHFKETLGPKGYFPAMLKHYLRFFSPRFHPSKQDDATLVEYWSKQLEQLTPVKVNGKSVFTPSRKEA